TGPHRQPSSLVRARLCSRFEPLAARGALSACSRCCRPPSWTPATTSSRETAIDGSDDTTCASCRTHDTRAGSSIHEVVRVMPVIELSTPAAAPPERVFDLARSIDLHVRSTSHTGERAVGGLASGLIGPGEEVTWRAKHLGVWQSLTVRITEFERLAHFADEMVQGAFRRMVHHHYFEPRPQGTLMRDVFQYESPFGLLGRVADYLFLERYMRTLLIERNRIIREIAESDAWQHYLREGT